MKLIDVVVFPFVLLSLNLLAVRKATKESENIKIFKQERKVTIAVFNTI